MTGNLRNNQSDQASRHYTPPPPPPRVAPSAIICFPDRQCAEQPEDEGQPDVPGVPRGRRAGHGAGVSAASRLQDVQGTGPSPFTLTPQTFSSQIHILFVDKSQLFIRTKNLFQFLKARISFAHWRNSWQVSPHATKTVFL